MVTGLILILGLVGVAFVFRKDITNFLSGGITGLGEDLSSALGQAGKDLDTFGKDQQKAFDDFVRDTQEGIDKSLAGSQQGINQFLKDAQTNFDSNIEGINQGIISQQKAIDQFGQDIQTNIANTVSGIQQGFTDFGEGVAQIISNPFGGQDKPKMITTKVNPMTLNKPIDRPRPTRSSIETTKPDILIMKDRPLTIGAIKPAIKPTVSKFLVSNPSERQEEMTVIKKEVESVASRRAGLRSRGGFGR